jgi:hypothetical protein
MHGTRDNIKGKAGEAKDWTEDKVDDLEDELGGHQ